MEQSKLRFEPKIKKTTPDTNDSNTLRVLKAVLRHDGCIWRGDICPHPVAGCNFCGAEFRAHDADCVWKLANDYVQSNGPISN